LPQAWRAELAGRLGERPRRLGSWAELALFGARTCLDAAGEGQLPAGDLLRLGSLIGPTATVLHALGDMRACTPPLPYTFLQSQPAVALAAMAAYLGWSGDAVLLNHRDPLAQLRVALAAAQGAQAAQTASPPAGLLIGWVEEAPEPCSHWLRLVPQRFAAGTPWRPMGADDWMSPHTQHLVLHGPMLMSCQDDLAASAGPALFTPSQR
jgi:hypothetical protein